MSPRLSTRNRGPDDPQSAAPAAPTSSPDAPTPHARVPGGHAPVPLSGRLSSALPRPFAGVSARLARRVPGGEASGGPGPVAADEAAAYQEALREAFRSATPLEPAVAARRPTPQPKAMPGAKVARPAAAEAPDAGSPTSPPAGAAPMPGAEVRLPAAAVADGPPVAGDPGPLGAVPDAAASPPAGSTPAGVPVGPGRRSWVPTAPADLIEVPGSVAIAADDFFGGLVRRVDRRP